MESQLLGSCLAWCQLWTDARWFSRRVGSCLSLSLSPWSTFLISLPTLLLCCGVLQPDLPGPSLLCVGYSQSLKKTKTPPLPKSEKPGKIPWSRPLRAGFPRGFKAPRRWVSAQGSCSCLPLIHSLIQSFNRNLFSTYVPGCGESLGKNSSKFLLSWSLPAREEECRQQIKTSEEDGCC